MTKKDPTIAFVLALLFGPLGLMYVRPGVGLALFGVAFVLSWTILVPIIIWFVCMLVAPSLARGRNQEREMK